MPVAARAGARRAVSGGNNNLYNKTIAISSHDLHKREFDAAGADEKQNLGVRCWAVFTFSPLPNPSKRWYRVCRRGIERPAAFYLPLTQDSNHRRY